MSLPPPPLPVRTTVARTSSLAIWSLVLGIAGFLLVLPAIPGFVCAIIAIALIKRSQGQISGVGLAIAGLIVSSCALAFSSWAFFLVWKELKEQRAEANKTLADARKGFATRLVRNAQTGFPVPEPPTDQLNLVRYNSSVGVLSAYMSVIPNDNQKHPAMVWLTGGFSNSINEAAWEPAPEDNDQSAKHFREAGVVTLYPSLRGGNDNPGFREILYGEVDDVLAATEFLANQTGIDPTRIYLGGHSTGGTLALLAAESSPRYRAVFAFGPVDRVDGYGLDELTFDTSNRQEIKLRSPVYWLHSIRSPTFVFEGESGNIDSLRSLMRASKNPSVRFHPVPGKDHFSIIAPYSRMIAQQIRSDTGPRPSFRFR